MSGSSQANPSLSTSLNPTFNTHYNRLRLCLALVILRNKPSHFTIKEYIDFVQCSIDCSTTTGAANCRKDILEAVKQQLKRKCTFEEDKVNINNDSQKKDVVCARDSRELEELKRVSNSDNPWKKRAFELEHEVERLKQRLCVFKIELENAKQISQVATTTTTARRKRTKPTEDHNIASSTPLATTITATNKKPSKKTAVESQKITSFFASKGYIDPDAQAIKQINAGDEGPWELFDIMQAMSFLQQMKNLRQPTLTSAQDSILAQTIIKIINYINFKLTALFSTKTSSTTCSNLWYTYSSCVQSFGNISKKLLEFLRLPTVPAAQHDEILSAIANALASLIRAIHPLTKIIFLESLQDETCAGNNKVFPNKDQDPREVITRILVNLCTNIEPRLKEPVAFVAAKECNRLMRKDPVCEHGASEHTLYHDSTFSKEKQKQQQFEDDNLGIFDEVILKDTGYYLLFVLDKIATCSADSGGKLNTVLTAETIKHIASLLESDIFKKDTNQMVNMRGDSLSVYISNIFEKLWTQRNNSNNSDFSLIERMIID
ncbi:3326_t:CDS:2 [Ambispora leptoticha]|uniref:3326_t:CDS:1 n=1 Tax=Ambispora leptoticha TaxID=144679 RepID=A0A9N9C4B3_9GLOM|nr:3326_t:CDS:2 [Ambispora leptoticha]